MEAADSSEILEMINLQEYAASCSWRQQSSKLEVLFVEPSYTEINVDVIVYFNSVEP
jgi:hypothetical protein